jgi:hypothetical protein
MKQIATGKWTTSRRDCSSPRPTAPSPATRGERESTRRKGDQGCDAPDGSDRVTRGATVYTAIAKRRTGNKLVHFHRKCPTCVSRPMPEKVEERYPEMESVYTELWRGRNAAWE